MNTSIRESSQSISYQWINREAQDGGFVYLSMFLGRYKIQQAVNDCSLILISDQTGLNSSSNPTGYGGVNPARAALTFLLIRTRPDGTVESVPIVWGTGDGPITICGADWNVSTGNTDLDCGCEPTQAASCRPMGGDGCYTYVLQAKQGDVVVSSVKMVLLQACETKKRLRTACVALGTSILNPTNDYLIRKWAIAWDLYQAIIEKPEPCCEVDEALLESIDLILRQIGY